MYPERLQLEITEEDIVAGVQGQARTCPYARSARRIFGEDVVVLVDGVTILVSQDGNFADVSYPLSSRAVRAIQRFDLDGVMEPHVTRTRRVRVFDALTPEWVKAV